MLTLLLALLLVVPDASPATWEVQPAASRVRIELRRSGLLKFLGHDHQIAAPLAAGRVFLVPDAPERSRVWLRWNADALHVVAGTEPAEDVPTVEERMRGPDVLAAATHPQILFASDRVTGSGADGEWTLRIQGTLSVRGRAQPIEVPLRVRLDGDRLTATGRLELSLKSLGVEPPSVAGVVNVADGLAVTFEVVAAR
ncbi:MAG: YceI family protein [Vicinamibacteria bacterium]|nr:YceI family protein [Vicinamibacteria bacterium]